MWKFALVCSLHPHYGGWGTRVVAEARSIIVSRWMSTTQPILAPSSSNRKHWEHIYIFNYYFPQNPFGQTGASLGFASFFFAWLESSLPCPGLIWERFFPQQLVIWTNGWGTTPRGGMPRPPQITSTNKQTIHRKNCETALVRGAIKKKILVFFDF